MKTINKVSVFLIIVLTNSFVFTTEIVSKEAYRSDPSAPIRKRSVQLGTVTPYCQTLLNAAKRRGGIAINSVLELLIYRACPEQVILASLKPPKDDAAPSVPVLQQLLANILLRPDAEKTTPAPRQCGTVVRTGRISPRIINGNPVKKHEYKFVVTILRRKSMICAGSIIDNRHVLSAAHCVENINPRDLLVGVAEHNINVPDGERLVQVKRVVRHPRHDRTVHDISILILAKPIRINRNEEPVCLPKGSECKNLRNRKCVIIGWGATLPNGGGFPKVPIDAKVSVYDADKCPYNVPRPSQPQTQICAVGQSDTCTGDSGGPLVCEYGGHWVQCGITSFGPSRCNARRTNGVYTSVAKHMAWIQLVLP